MFQNLDAYEDIINNANVARLKEKFLKEEPQLCKQRNCKFALLKLDGQVGKA